MKSLVVIFAALLISAAARADSIDYAGAGSLSNHTASVTGSATAGNTWGTKTELVEIDDVTSGTIQQGDLGDVMVTTGTLMSCASGLCFTGGTLDIVSASGQSLVNETFVNGTISRIGGNTFLNAVLPNGATVLLEDSRGNFSSDSTVSTSAAVPEPASLSLLGAGMIGLWWAGREKIKRISA